MPYPARDLGNVNPPSLTSMMRVDPVRIGSLTARKDGHHVTYFDSFGNLQPPEEITQYLGESSIIQYNQTYQDFNSYRCGHLCLDFLTSYKKA